MLDWMQYFKLPLKLDSGGCCSYIWHSGKGSCMAFNCLCEPETEEDLAACIIRYQEYVDKINGTSKKKFDGTFTLSENKEEILFNNEPVLLVRGWGMLTGIGGHRLNPEVAKGIQDSFISYCCNKLNES